MVFGQSKDLGTCRSTKKNGEKCTAFVNTNRCEYCIYHVKQEYQKCSRRSELQSSFAGRGLIALRNKVLGKNEVFYAGKSYTAIPASKCKKLAKKDESRLNLLSGAKVSVTKGVATQVKIKKHAAQVEAGKNQRKRDLDILRKLGALNEDKTNSEFAVGELSSSVTLEESKKTALDVISKLKAKQKSSTDNAKKEESVISKVNDERNGVDIKIGDKSESKIALQPPETGDIDLSVDFGKKIEKVKKSELSSVKSNFKKKNLETTRTKSNLNTLVDKEKALFNIDFNKKKDICTNDEKTEKHSLNVVSQPENDNRVSNVDCNAEAVNCSQKLLSKENLVGVEVPQKVPIAQNLLNLSKPLPRRKIERAKQSALKYVQKNGPIEKIDPNSVRGSKKRVLADPATDVEKDAKRQKKIQENEFYSEKFKKMMAMTSRNADLLELRDDDEKEKYFDKMEMREKMEEKMTSTYKVPCKAVRCLKCKYTSFSAADRCKAERHPLKVADATKRFFKCGDCGNRTVCLEVVPTKPCNNCGSGKWERTTMMKERIITVSHGLSIRGGEQKFVNSVVADSNINLLVPDE